MACRLEAPGDIGMNARELKRLTALGEDSGRQFKEDVRNADSLAAEMVALSNSVGGVILIGLKDGGMPVGVSPADVRRVNRLISNAATQGMRGPIAPRTENVHVGKDRIVVVLTIPEGLDKPYFDRQGVIWVKAGPDKRRVQSKEELQRLFQAIGLVYADEVPTQAGIERVSRGRLREFVPEVFGGELPDDGDELARLLENMNLARDGKLNLAGLLLFAERPQSVRPAFVVKAVRYPGSDIASDTYLDMEDFEGTLSAQFEGALAFILRNLPKVQPKGSSVNSPGKLPIPRIVFEELLVNALIHRHDAMEAAAFATALSEARESILREALADVPETRPAQLVGKRLRVHGAAYFQFITTPGIEPTNNLAERAIRFVAIDRRITQGTRGERGRQWSERIWTVLATCAAQGRSAFDDLVQVVQTHFTGQPVPSLLAHPP